MATIRHDTNARKIFRGNSRHGDGEIPGKFRTPLGMNEMASFCPMECQLPYIKVRGHLQMFQNAEPVVPSPKVNQKVALVDRPLV